jgi:peptide/nickel transport system substrate-binding protein
MNTSAFRAFGALVLSAVLAGCSGGGQQGDSDSFAVRVRLEASAPVLNPYMPSPGYSRFVAANIFQSLGILDPESLELKPLLLKDIPSLRRISGGARAGQYAYDFQINPTARWDNGTAVTSRDVAFTLKVIFHPMLSTQAWRGYFEQLKGFEMAPGDSTRFTMFVAPYYMLALESICQVPVLPAYHYDPEGLLGAVDVMDLLEPKRASEMVQANPGLQAFASAFQQPVYSNEPDGICGSNAYRLGGFAGDDGLVLFKKANWWGDSAAQANPYLRAYPDSIIYRVVKDDVVLENMLRAGELDVAVSVNPARFLDMQKDPSLLDVYDFQTRPQAVYTRWMLNMRHPVLKDRAVRQALAYVVDYDYLVGNVLQGLAVRTVGPVGPEKAFYNNNLAPYTHSAVEARRLLEAAGWRDSDGDGILEKVVDGVKAPLSLSLLTTMSTTVSEQTAAALVKNAMEAGIKLVLQPVEFNELTARTRSGNFETAILGAAVYPGLVELYQNFHSKSLAPAGDNRSGIADPALDRLIEGIRSAENDQDRNKLYLEAQEIIHREVPEVYLYAPRQRYVVSKRFDYVISANRPGYYEPYFKPKR